MASDRLTITITGPQGCGKDLLAEWLEQNLPRTIRRPYERAGKVLDAVMIVGEGADVREVRL